MCRGRVEQEGEKWRLSGRVLAATTRTLGLILSEMESHQCFEERSDIIWLGFYVKHRLLESKDRVLQPNASKHYQPLPHGAGFIQDFTSSPMTTITTITPPDPEDTSRTKRERRHLITVHREVQSLFLDLSSLCMILMGSKCSPSPLVSQELVTFFARD